MGKPKVRVLEEGRHGENVPLVTGSRPCRRAPCRLLDHLVAHEGVVDHPPAATHPGARRLAKTLCFADGSVDSAGSPLGTHSRSVPHLWPCWPRAQAPPNGARACDGLAPLQGCSSGLGSSCTT